MLQHGQTLTLCLMKQASLTGQILYDSTYINKFRETESSFCSWGRGAVSVCLLGNRAPFWEDDKVLWMVVVVGAQQGECT